MPKSSTSLLSLSLFPATSDSVFKVNHYTRAAVIGRVFEGYEIAFVPVYETRCHHVGVI